MVKLPHTDAPGILCDFNSCFRNEGDEMLQSQTIGKLVEALTKAQDAFDPILKDKNNPFFHSKYADLATVVTATQPALIANGLAVVQFPVSENDRVGVLTLLVHISGEFIGESYTLPTAKQDAQSGVAAVTYARRAAYQGILGVAAEDDDGNTAAGRQVRNEEESAPSPLPTRRRVSQAPAENGGSREAARSNRSGPPPAEIPSELPSGEPGLGAYQDEPGNEPQREPGDEPISQAAPVQPAMPTGGAAPTEKELNVYRAAMGKLGDDLAAAGLKASRNLPINQKVIAYLLKCTGAPDPKQVSVPQWETFFQIVDNLKGRENGPSTLIKLVNEAALPRSK
jgi:ERF superfamily